MKRVLLAAAVLVLTVAAAGAAEQVVLQTAETPFSIAVPQADGAQPEQVGQGDRGSAEADQRDRPGETLYYSRYGHTTGEIFWYQ